MAYSEEFKKLVEEMQEKPIEDLIQLTELDAREGIDAYHRHEYKKPNIRSQAADVVLSQKGYWWNHESLKWLKSQ